MVPCMCPSERSHKSRARIFPRNPDLGSSQVPGGSFLLSVAASATQAARAFSSLGVGAGAELAGTALISRPKVSINEAHDSVARTELIIRPSLSHLNVENGTFAFTCRISLAVRWPMAAGRGRTIHGIPDVRAHSNSRRNPSQGDACLIDPVDQNRETNCVGPFEAVWDNAPRQRMK